jgi:hypothetical protein
MVVQWFWRVSLVFSWSCFIDIVKTSIRIFLLFLGGFIVQSRNAFSSLAVCYGDISCSHEWIQRAVRQQWPTAVYHREMGHAK